MCEKKVLHILKSPAYKNDSRVLKWVDSLSNYHILSTIFILEDANENYTKNEAGNTIIAYSLKFRYFFSKGSGLLFKTIENFFKVQKFLNKSRDEFDYIIFHDNQNYLSLIYESRFKKTSNKIIWDQHELIHTSLLRNKIVKPIFKSLIENIKLVVFANQARLDFTKAKIDLRSNNTFILNNAVDKQFIINPKSTIPTNLSDWLKGDPYIIWLGEGSRRRNFNSFLMAFHDSKINYKIVVLGKIEPELINLIETLGLTNYIYQTFVRPEEMASYIDSASFSCVLYKNISPNNFYCEPNRLYQLTTRNIPVIVGNNPPLKDYVDFYGNGYVLTDDGTSVKDLTKAIITVENNLKNYNVPSLDSFQAWEDQFKPLINLLS